MTAQNATRWRHQTVMTWASKYFPCFVSFPLFSIIPTEREQVLDEENMTATDGKWWRKIVFVTINKVVSSRICIHFHPNAAILNFSIKNSVLYQGRHTYVMTHMLTKMHISLKVSKAAQYLNLNMSSSRNHFRFRQIFLKKQLTDEMISRRKENVAEVSTDMLLCRLQSTQ